MSNETSGQKGGHSPRAESKPLSDEDMESIVGGDDESDHNPGQPGDTPWVSTDPDL